MPREHLIIQNKTIKKLERAKPASANESTTTSELAKTFRIWTDKSGQHKVEAWFLRKTETEVVLTAAASREIKLAINKLCDADQALIKNAQSPVENPFD